MRDTVSNKNDVWHLRRIPEVDSLISIQVHICTYRQAQISTHVPVYICVPGYTSHTTCAYIGLHAHTCTLHEYTCAYTQVPAHTCIPHTCTCVHRYAHEYTHNPENVICIFLLPLRMEPEEGKDYFLCFWKKKTVWSN